MTKTSNYASLILVSITAMIGTVRAGEQLPLKNPGFEEELDGWIIAERDLAAPMSVVQADAAHSGDRGLRVTDEDAQKGSSLTSQLLPAEPGMAYNVTFFAKTQTKDRGGVYLRFFDSTKKLIPQDKPSVVVVSTVGDWNKYDLEATAPENSAFVGIWIHTWADARGIIEFDDFTLESSK